MRRERSLAPSRAKNSSAIARSVFSAALLALRRSVSGSPPLVTLPIIAFASRLASFRLRPPCGAAFNVSRQTHRCCDDHKAFIAVCRDRPAESRQRLVPVHNPITALWQRRLHNESRRQLSFHYVASGQHWVSSTLGNRRQQAEISGRHKVAVYEAETPQRQVCGNYRKLAEAKVT